MHPNTFARPDTLHRLYYWQQWIDVRYKTTPDRKHMGTYITHTTYHTKMKHGTQCLFHT